MRGTPAEVAAKWKRNLDNSTPDIEAGILRVTVAPGIAAAAAAEKFVHGIQQSVNDGTWQKRVSAVTLQEWQDAAIKKGIGRIREGTSQALPKQEKFFTALEPAIDAAKAVIDRMPSITFEDSLARAAAFMREMHKFNYKAA